MLYLIAQQAAETELDPLFTVISFVIALIPSFFAIRWMLNSGKGKKHDLQQFSQEFAEPMTPEMTDEEIQKKLEKKTKLMNKSLIKFLPYPFTFFILFFISKEIIASLLVISYKTFCLNMEATQQTVSLSYTTAQIIILTMTSLFIAIGGIFAVGKFTKFPTFKAFFTGRDRKFRDILEAVLILFLSTIFIYFVVKVLWYLILQNFGVSLEEQVQIKYLRESKNLMLWLATTFAVVVGAPIFEEIVFRGFLFQALRKHQSIMLAATSQGFIFAILHMSLSAFLPLWVLGVVLALMAEKFQSLLPSIIAHAIFNGITILMLYNATF
ncbi:MAG: CPBP family intramembrane metalloprotease [Planctomycetes bacterium]|nr:CPBP family intramembrane metalloprotease [Planctomycetota bacterium]